MTLTNDELTELLDRLLAGWEHVVVEFKELKGQLAADRIGEHASALGNQASLRGRASGWQGVAKITNGVTKRWRHRSPSVAVLERSRGGSLAYASNRGVQSGPSCEKGIGGNRGARGPGSA